MSSHVASSSISSARTLRGFGIGFRPDSSQTDWQTMLGIASVSGSWVRGLLWAGRHAGTEPMRGNRSQAGVEDSDRETVQ